MRITDSRNNALFVVLFLVCAVALVATWVGGQKFTEHQLKQEATSNAVRWARFVVSQSPELARELAESRVSRDTISALRLASGAGGVFRYKLFGPDGLIVHASRPGDIGKKNTKPYFLDQVMAGGTYAKIETEEDFGAQRTVVSEAYVPLMDGNHFRGAVEVYVDETETAARLDIAMRQSFLGIALIMSVVAVLWAVFVWQDMRSRQRIQRKLTAHRDELQERVDAATADLQAKARELEQALQKEIELNALQREFVSMASHEFRTPLAIIDSTAQRMKKSARRDQLTPDEALARIEKIRGAVARMTRLMESTLYAARMEGGRIKVDLADCPIADVVREACTRHQEISPGHRITCRVGDMPATVRADAAAVEQIVTNLLSNAVKYSCAGTGIEVEATSDGPHVVLSVRDQGIGIAEDELDRIGERFFRARSSAGIEGTGIGLNLAKTLLDMHGGDLQVESTAGVGSTFTVRLPIDGPAAAAA